MSDGNKSLIFEYASHMCSNIIAAILAAVATGRIPSDRHSFFWLCTDAKFWVSLVLAALFATAIAVRLYRRKRA